MIPVVFVHYGPVPEYLKTSIAQAAKYNDVILITDQSNVDVKATLVQIADVAVEAEQFENVYHHLSKNPEEFELRCFTRWGLIKTMMEKSGLKTIFYCDSDVLLYTRIESHFTADAGIAYSIPEEQPEFRWSASAHVSLFSYEKLSLLWKFMMDAYITKGETFKQLKNKYKHHLVAQLPGGVCDMTLLYLFSKEHEVFPICKVIDGATFDHNINSSENSIKEEYDMRQIASPYGPMTIKNIRFIDGSPYCLNNDEDQEIKFHSLHFQGGAKSIMQQFTK